MILNHQIFATSVATIHNHLVLLVIPSTTRPIASSSRWRDRASLCWPLHTWPTMAIAAGIKTWSAAGPRSHMTGTSALSIRRVGRVGVLRRIVPIHEEFPGRDGKIMAKSSQIIRQ